MSIITLRLQAENVRAKYRFEIDRKVDAFEFFKAKFNNDQEKIKNISNLLYKKLK